VSRVLLWRWRVLVSNASRTVEFEPRRVRLVAISLNIICTKLELDVESAVLAVVSLLIAVVH
jgi:hypothetical protein